MGTALNEKNARSQGEPPRDSPQRSESVGAAANAPVQVDLLSQIEPEVRKRDLCTLLVPTAESR